MKISFLPLITKYWWGIIGIIGVIVVGTIVWIMVIIPEQKSTATDLARAQEYYSEGDLSAAKQQYESIISRRPNDYLALNGLGNVLRDQNNLIDAERMYLQVIKINPGFEFVYRNLLGVYQAWPDATEKSAKMANFESLLKKGLAANGKSVQIISTALDYYHQIGNTAKADELDDKLSQLLK